MVSQYLYHKIASGKQIGLSYSQNNLVVSLPINYLTDMFNYFPCESSDTLFSADLIFVNAKLFHLIR